MFRAYTMGTLDQNKSILLNLLSAGLFHSGTAFEGSIDWDGMFAESKMQSIPMLVGQMCMEHIPAGIRQKWTLHNVILKGSVSAEKKAFLYPIGWGYTGFR